MHRRRADGGGGAAAARVPAHLAHPGADLRHPGHEPGPPAGLHRAPFPRPRRLLRRWRLRRRHPRGRAPRGIRRLSGGRARRGGHHGGALRPARHPRHRDLLPDDHPRPRHGGLGARLPLGLADQGRQRDRGRAAARARTAVEPLGGAAVLLLRPDRGDRGVGPPRAARALALRARAGGHPRERVPDAGPGVQRVAPQVPRLRALGHARRLRRGVLGLLQRLREPGRRAARDLGRDAPDGGTGRPGNAPRARRRRRDHRVPQELRERLHQALALDPGRSLYRRHPLRPARPGGRAGSRATVSNLSMRYIIRALLLAAVVTVSGPAGGALGQGGPIKIGLLAPLSGAFSATGKDMVVGAELYLDEIGRQAAGRKIELIVEDSEGTPATALTKARKLVEQDRVHVLTGGLLASTGYALQPFVDGQRIPTTFPVIAADDLTQRKPARWIVRTGWTTSQPMHPFGDWVARTLKYKRVATIGMDYAFGWETGGGFQRSFEDAGGQVVQKIWTPLNANDSAPFLAQVKRDADAVLALFVGRLALQFMKHYE